MLAQTKVPPTGVTFMRKIQMPHKMNFFHDCKSTPGIARYASTKAVCLVSLLIWNFLGKTLDKKTLIAGRGRQTIQDVTRIREAVTDAHLLVRINPLPQMTAPKLN